MAIKTMGITASSSATGNFQIISNLPQITATRLRYYANGFKPVPTNGKRPEIPAWREVCGSAGPEDIRKHADMYPSCQNTGILCGEVVGVDIDVTDRSIRNDIYHLARRLLGATPLQRIGKAPKILLVFRAEKPHSKVQTPDYFLAGKIGDPEAKVKVEVLAEGQQFVGDGIHPDTGQPYRWIGKTPAEVRLEEIPVAALDKLEQFKREAETILRDRGCRSRDDVKDAQRPSDTSYRDSELSYEDVASALRAIPNTFDRDGYIRIGYAVWAATGTSGYDLFRDWAQQHPSFNERNARRDWASFRKGRGDITAGTLIHYAQEHGWRRPSLPNRRPTPEPKQPIQQADWPEPKPLPNGLAKVDDFNMEFMPDKLVPWIDEIAERLQCPPDFVGVSVIAGLGAVIGRRVGIKPQSKTDWTEVPNLWGMFIGRPGMLKSPAMMEALKPLHHLEALATKDNAQSEARYKADVEAYAMRKAVRQSLLKEAMKKAAKPEAAIDPGFDLGVEPTEPLPVRFCTNDSSYEKLGELLTANPMGILVERDELVSLLRHLDAEDQAVARGFYLSGWSGQQPYTFDRIGRGHVHVEAVCISVLGNTQPSRIAEYVKRANADGGGGDGLLQRFGLMVWPDAVPVWRDVDEYPNRENRELAFGIFSALSKLTEQQAINRGASKGVYDSVPFFRFTEEALVEFLSWRSDFEPRLRSGELSPALEGHLAKYRKLVPALALINHLVDSGSYGEEVSQVSLVKALAFAKYLESHGRRVYGASNTADVAAAKAILNHIRRGDLNDGFTARELQRHDWSGLTDREHVKAGLDLLVDHDYLETTTAPSTTGRPKTTYTINPRGLK